jgi:hypothetical protein
MCEFISWIEHNNDIYFLTSRELQTKEGRELKKYLDAQYYEDIKGHGAIDKYYGLKGKGTHKECDDFSTPNNFPGAIVQTIKTGKFEGVGIAKGILTQSAYAEYEKVRQAAEAEYEKVRQAAYAEYEKVRQSAYAEYEKVRQAAEAEYQKVRHAAYAEYEKVRQAAYAEYEKVRQPAEAEYQKVRQAAEAEYQKVCQAAYAEYQKVCQAKFWMLVKNPDNRVKTWK